MRRFVKVNLLKPVFLLYVIRNLLDQSNCPPKSQKKRLEHYLRNLREFNQSNKHLSTNNLSNGALQHFAHLLL
jgi:hypothetical protein